MAGRYLLSFRLRNKWLNVYVLVVVGVVVTREKWNSARAIFQKNERVSWKCFGGIRILLVVLSFTLVLPICKTEQTGKFWTLVNCTLHVESRQAFWAFPVIKSIFSPENLPTIHTYFESINGIKKRPGWIWVASRFNACQSVKTFFLYFIVSMTKSYPKCVVLIVECLTRTEKLFSSRLFNIFMLITECPDYF